MKQKSDTLGTVSRTIEMLRYIAEHSDIAIRDLSQDLGLAPSTCHRLLELLQREGMVEHDKARRRYRTGPEFFRIAAQVHTRYDVRNLALPYLRKVVESCNETCVLSLYDAASRKLFLMEKVDSTHALRYQLPMNTPITLMWGSSGRSVLAYLPSEVVDQIYQEERKSPATGVLRPARDELDVILSDIRERGVATSAGQRIAEAVGVFSPVFRADNRVIGSFGVTIPNTRIEAADMDGLCDLIRRTSSELSRSLGADITIPGPSQ